MFISYSTFPVSLLMVLAWTASGKISFLPKSNLGKKSVGFIVVFFALFGLFHLLIISGQRGGETFFSNLFLTIPALLMAISGVAAFFVGIFAIIKKKERAVLV